jgi:hypothetical protein
MRGKVLEALAMARPMVTTSVGAEGLGATPGRDLLVADGAPEFAAAVCRLLGDPALAARLGAAGRDLVRERFDWDAVAAAHADLYERVARGPRRRHPAPRPVWSLPGRLGRGPALAAGVALVALRGLRWHLHRRPPVAARPLGGTVDQPAT